MPVWHYTLDIKDIWQASEDDRELDFAVRDEIVRRIKLQNFYSEDDPVLSYIVLELSEAQDFDTFNEWWHTFYDYADHYRIWVKTF